MRADAAPEEHDLATGAPRDVAEEPQAMDVRREHRDDDGAGRAFDERLEHGADVDLVAGRALGVDVRRVAHEQRDARVAELAEALGVEVLAVGRRLVELEVAAVDEHARVGGDGERGRVGDRVRHADRLDAERADVERRARARLEEPRVREHLVLAEPLADETERVRRRPHRHVVTLAGGTAARRCGPRGRA